jgi:CRP/FNR family transcriptional regulator, anaerobic regulatory protein
MTLENFPLHRPEFREQLVAGDAAIASAMQPPQLFRAREPIVREGDGCDFVYRVMSGWAVRCRSTSIGKRQIIAVFLPGDLCGVKSMFLERQPEGIECLTDVSAQAIEYGTLRGLARQNFAIVERLMFQLGEDERHLHNWGTALGRGDAEQRIATFMLDLRGRLHRVGLLKDDTFRFPMTQQQIGDHLGLTVVHVNRVLRRLREAGALAIHNGVVSILDSKKLGETAAPLQDVFERDIPAFSGGTLYRRPHPNGEAAQTAAHLSVMLGRH